MQLLFIFADREVSEWLKELPWKGSIRATVSRVRIPSSLQLKSPIEMDFLFFK